LRVTVQNNLANRGLRVGTRSGYYGEANEGR
jgi:hypothetical protein